MWAELSQLFTSMQWYVILILCIGILFVFIEFFVPGFGFFGISGLTCIVAGIVTHAVLTKSIIQVVALVLIFSLVLIIVFLLFIRSARFGLLGKTPFIEKKTAVPTDYAKKSEFANLVGEIGVAVTPLRPSGKFMIDEKVYEGICETAEMIETGEYVKVVKVEGIKIIVEKTEV